MTLRARGEEGALRGKDVPPDRQRREQPHFANARSIRNALDRARLRQANRLFSRDRPVTAAALCTMTQADNRASRVFSGGLGAPGSRRKDDPHGL